VRLSGYGKRTFSAPSRHHLRQEPYEVIPQVRICAGGAGQPASLPRPFLDVAIKSERLGIRKRVRERKIFDFDSGITLHSFIKYAYDEVGNIVQMGL